MSRTVTLTLLRDDIRFQADLIGATVRHTDAQLTRLINQSIQEFREAISNEGNQHYLTASSGTLTAGATSPYSFGSLDLSAISPSIVRTYGLDVTVDGVVYTLDHRPFTERNIWGGPATTGIPRHWAHYQTAKLAIQPAPASAYAYTLWYLPVLADLSADADTFNGVAGWESWIVWDVVCRLLIRDQQGQAFASAKLYRDDTWSRIQRQATRVSSAGGAVVGRDTLRGRIPDPLAARGPIMAGGGLPASHSVVLSMLSEQTGPVFLGRIVGTGDVQPMTPAESAGILPLFSPSGPGLVPAAGGSSISKFLSQAGTFETVASSGGGSPGGPSGSIQFAGLSGFVGYTGFAVQGSPPSMTVRLPGSFRVTGGTVDVGSGTVRMSASGIDLGGGQLANVSSLFAFPTFAAGVPGLVPASSNNATDFLRSDGAFSAPPGVPSGASFSIQYNNGGAFGGATGIRVAGSGTALEFGNNAASAGNLRFPNDTGLLAWARVGGGNVLGPYLDSANGLLVGAPNGGFLAPDAQALYTATGGSVYARLGSLEYQLGAAGAVFPNTLTLGSGLSNANLAPMGSGTVKGNLSGTGAPSDISIPTLHAFAPTFTATKPGIVPQSGGDSNNFLNGAGGWSVPPGGAASPGGVLGNIQYNNGVGGFDGASGITIIGSGAASSQDGGGVALAFGNNASGSAGGGIGTIRSGNEFSIFGVNASGINVRLTRLSPTGAAGLATMASIQWGTVTSNRLYRQHWAVGTGGVMSWEVGGTGTTALLSQTGMDLSQFPLSAKSLTLGSGVANDTLAQMASGTVKAALTLGVPADVRIPTLAAFFPTFTAARAGLVAPGDGDASKFLNAAGLFAAPTGFTFTPTGLPNANLAVMPSGTVKANLTGTGVPSDVLIPTLFMFAPTMTSARAGIVGPGGGSLTNFLRGDGAFAAPTGFTFTPTGLPNANLAVMPSGTVKANLTGTGAPADVLIPTLMMHFPTFTSARPGIVAPGDGDTGKFLNAAGLFATPVAAATPGGDSGNVQWNNGGAMAGASAIHAVAAGAALAIGPSSLVADRGDLRVASGFMLAVRNPSGIAQPLLEAYSASGTFRIGGSGLPRMLNDVASGGVQEFSFGGATTTTARLLPTGLDASSFHIRAKSLDVGHINGLPFDFNALKRGIDISTFTIGGTGAGIPSGLNLYLPRGAGSGANRFIVPSGIVGTGTQFVTLNPTGGKGGGVIRIEKLSTSGSNFEVRTPTGTVLHAFPSGTKGWADFMFEKPSGAVFQLAGQADIF